ncbi:unnamed protein product [Prunus armeniaca]
MQQGRSWPLPLLPSPLAPFKFLPPHMASSRTLSPSWIYRPSWAAATNPKHNFLCPLRKMCRVLARVLTPPPSILGLLRPPSLLRMLVSLALGSVFLDLFLDWLLFPSLLVLW